MLFNSIEFLLFLPIVMLGYWLLKGYRTSLLLLASYVFYGWWNWPYLALIIFSTLVDFYCGKGIAASNSKERKIYLWISLSANIGVLAFFKYFNFFSQEANKLFDLLNMEYLIPYSSFLLPMGISFYTFQTMAYTIDVYNGKIKEERNVMNFALYVSFFPQLVAGPIERAGHLLGQLKDLKPFKNANIQEGFYRIVFGLFKKVVIADRLALFVNQVYNSPQDYDGSMLLLATVFFAFQIYCDFSGYSDIAIGVARLFGVELMENFKNPYLAKNIREFWSRWHISLSTWFRDYVYIPLGGNKNKFYRNILIVFLVSGLWHGANWTFIVWGGLHGLYFLLTQFLTSRFAFLNKSFLNSSGVLITFVFVCITWIFFRANNVQDAWLILSKLPNVDMSKIKDLAYQLMNGILHPTTLKNAFNLSFGEFYFQSSIGDILLSFIFIPLLVVMETVKLKNKIQLNPNQRALVYFVLASFILMFGVFTENQFIYFQF